jgi:hypothetical protein
MAVERPTRVGLVALLPISLIVAGCGDDDEATETADDAWGPLAVLSGPPSGEEALIAGSLHVNEDCVTLEEGAGEQRVLLVWPSEGTTWNPQTRVIDYSDGTRTVELSDGDEVAFGGGGSSADEGGLTAREWAASIDGWASEPDPSCPADERWFVGGLPPTSSAGS